MPSSLPAFSKLCLTAGALNALLAVAIGAFGAHGLRQQLAPSLLALLETGARYQMTHSLALLATAWLASRLQTRLVHAAGTLFLLGILLFSGSLYALSLTGLRIIGMITPLGGLCFMAGWLCLVLAAWRRS